MEITRNGKAIKLTQEELLLAHREYMSNKVATTSEANLIMDDDIDLSFAELTKLNKEDIKIITQTAENIGKQEVRMVIDAFYQIQKNRTAFGNRIKAIEKGNDDGSTILLKYLYDSFLIMEKTIKNAMDKITDNNEVGRWCKSVTGIGPILAANLLATFDVKGKEYASQFISYAGLNDNNRPWLGAEASKKIVNEIMEEAGTKKVDTMIIAKVAAKTQWSVEYLTNNSIDKKGNYSKDALIKACSKVPYNRDAKKMMYLLSDQFAKWQLNKDSSKYAKLYKERLAYEIRNNEAGKYAQQAEVRATQVGKSTEAYKAYSVGKLPDAHLIMRSRRWVEKIFLSHLFEEMYRVEYDKLPPRYYILEHNEGVIDEAHNKMIDPEVPFTEVSNS